jgi:hypothetical protein
LAPYSIGNEKKSPESYNFFHFQEVTPKTVLVSLCYISAEVCRIWLIVDSVYIKCQIDASTPLANGSRRCSKERAHTAALNRRLAAGRTRDGKAQLVPLGLRDARQRGRRGPLQKLRGAPRAVEAADRAVVEPGVEQIANINRIVPAVVGEARDKDKRKRVALPTRSPVAVVMSPSLESTSGRSRSSTAKPSFSSTVACASA